MGLAGKMEKLNIYEGDMQRGDKELDVINNYKEPKERE